jgi:SAM-dependent methyltransferase
VWEERISRATHPAILLEHVLRYRMTMPILKASRVWADLGCGAGVAAAHALEDGFTGQAILVDNDQPSLDAARDELAPKIEEIVTLPADLTFAEDLSRLAAELSERASAREGCITCFEVVEHLGNFVPLLELLKDATGRLGYTAILSVPNDSFWSMENPHHQATWGAESFEEMLRLLPEPRTVAHQNPLMGSSILTASDVDRSELDLRVPVSMDGVPSHYLVAFGPKADLIASIGEARQSDLEQQRSWERQRETHLTYLEQREEDLMWLLSRCEAELADARGVASNGETGRSVTDASP